MIIEQGRVKIDYRLPNIVEGLRMESEIREAFKEKLTENVLLAETILRMGPLVDTCYLGGEKVDWDNLLSIKEARPAILRAADSIVGDLFLGEEKKSE